MSIHLFSFRSSARFLFPIIAFLFSVLAGITFAAWLDAPNAPPNYGVIGCTPPCEQKDFMPMNLGTSPQTKKGPITIEGSITGEIFFDQNPAYFIDPSSSSAAKLAGRVFIEGGPLGIRQSFTVSSGALLAVNYPSENTAKTGSVGDAIYAYANSAKAAISVEQGNPEGYAVYSSGGINYFGGGVQVGSAADPKNLCLNGDCKTAWPSVSGGVANYLTKWTGATALGNSVIYDDGTNVGIGTASPGAKLDVAGDVKFNDVELNYSSMPNSISVQSSRNVYAQVLLPNGFDYYMQVPLYHPPAPSASYCAGYSRGGCYSTKPGTPTLLRWEGETAYYEYAYRHDCCSGNEANERVYSKYDMVTRSWTQQCIVERYEQWGC